MCVLYFDRTYVGSTVLTMDVFGIFGIRSFGVLGIASSCVTGEVRDLNGSMLHACAKSGSTEGYQACRVLNNVRHLEVLRGDQRG